MNNAKFALKSRFAAMAISLVAVAGLFFIEYGHSKGQLWDFRFNAYALPSLLTFALCVGLLMYFVNKPARTDERIWIAVFLASLCIFAGGETLQRFSSSPNAALFWTMLSAVGISVYPVTLYLFSLAYTNQTDRKYPGVTMILLSTSFIFIFFYGFTNIMFDNDPAHMKLYPWGFNNVAGDGLIFPLVWLDTLLILTIMRLVNFRRRTRNVVLRRQSMIFIFATLIPVVGGSIFDGLLPIMGVTSLPPLAMTLSSVTAVLLTYGVLRFQLLTISPTLFSDTILSIMHEAVVVTDAEFKVLHMNPEAQALLGVEGLAATQRLSLLDFVPNEQAATNLRRALSKPVKAELSKTEKRVNLERIDIEAQNGHSTPVRVTASMLQSAGFEAHVIVLTDITEHLRTESIIERQVQVRTEELREARAYLVASINSLEQGFVLVDQKLNIVLTNGMAQKLMDSNENLIGSPLLKATAGIEWNIKLAETAQRVMDKKEAERLQAAAEDGRFYVVFMTPVLSGNEVLGVAVIVEDVTEQRILERSKDEFFSIASHELRTPLTAIRGNMSMVEEYYPEVKKNKELETMIHDTHMASLRLIEIVNDFLDSSRLEQGKMEFHLEPVAIKPIVDTVCKDLAEALKSQGNELELKGLSELPMVQADAGRVQQIVENLLSNAIKYTNNGHITIAASVHANKLHLSVSDTGKGISPESQKLLFRKFQQATESILTRDNTKGTGLGLYIGKLLATNMGGDIKLERTEVGKGSVFTVQLPLVHKK